MFSNCFTLLPPSLSPGQISHSFYVVAAYLEEAVKNCPQVRCVDLTRMEVVGDRLVRVVREWCGELRKLNVEGCTRVSPATLDALRAEGVELDVPVEQMSGFQVVPGQI